MSHIFLAVDGDDIGSALENLILRNDLEAVAHFSASFRQDLDFLMNDLRREHMADIVFEGGDNLLASIVDGPSIITMMDHLRCKFQELDGHTVSMGVGKSPRQAYFALKLAKASGKNCLRTFAQIYDEDNVK